MKSSFVVFVALLATVAVAAHNCTKHKPMVVIPGIMATILDGSADGIPESFKMPSYCHRTFKERRFWLNAEAFIPGVFQCWKSLMRFYWNNATNTYDDVPNFDITIPEFGTFYPIETVDPSPIFSKITNFMGDFKKNFVSHGYVDGTDLNAAGTDWRNIPTTEWIERTRKLVEETYQKNGNSKVVIFGHSMGCLFSYNFLRSQSSDWLNKYIDSYIAAAGPWSGAPKSVSVMFRGMKDYLPLLDDFLLDVVRNIPGLLLLLPRPEGFPAGGILAHTPHYDYTYAETGQLLTDAGMIDGVMKAKIGYKYAPDLDHPFPFKTTCIAGKGKTTQGGFVWDKPLTPGEPEGTWVHPAEDVNVDGDATVPLSSARILCDKWGETTVELYGATHIGMLKDQRLFDVVEDSVCLD